MGVPWTIGNIQTEIFIRKKFYSLARIYRIKDISRMCPFGTHTLFACVSLRETHAQAGGFAPRDISRGLRPLRYKQGTSSPALYTWGTKVPHVYVCPFGTHIPERGASPPAIYAWGTLVPHALSRMCPFGTHTLYALRRRAR